MASQRTTRPVIAYNYKLVRDKGVEAEGAIIAPKATDAVAVAVASVAVAPITRTPAPEASIPIEDDIDNDDNDFDALETSTLQLPDIQSSAIQPSEFASLSVTQSHLRVPLICQTLGLRSWVFECHFITTTLNTFYMLKRTSKRLLDK
jgi:hypothetical protein